MAKKNEEMHNISKIPIAFNIDYSKSKKISNKQNWKDYFHSKYKKIFNKQTWIGYKDYFFKPENQRWVKGISTATALGGAIFIVSIMGPCGGYKTIENRILAPAIQTFNESFGKVREKKKGLEKEIGVANKKIGEVNKNLGKTQRELEAAKKDLDYKNRVLDRYKDAIKNAEKNELVEAIWDKGAYDILYRQSPLRVKVRIRPLKEGEDPKQIKDNKALCAWCIDYLEVLKKTSVWDKKYTEDYLDLKLNVTLENNCLSLDYEGTEKDKIVPLKEKDIKINKDYFSNGD